MRILQCRIVDILVKRNPQCVRWKDGRSRTPLHYACRYGGDVQTVKCLVNAKADVDAELVVIIMSICWFKLMLHFRDDRGATPLLDASDEQTNTELVKILLDAGAEASPPKIEGKVRHQQKRSSICKKAKSNFFSSRILLFKWPAAMAAVVLYLFL